MPRAIVFNGHDGADPMGAAFNLVEVEAWPEDATDEEREHDGTTVD